MNEANQQRVEFAPGLVACAGGGLWLPSEETLLVADVHLGYAWAQRRKGQLGPLTDGAVHEKLLHLTERLRPRRLVVLGDLVHAARPAMEERAVIERTLESLCQQMEMVLVRGNHDRGFARDFRGWPIRLAPYWQGHGVTAAHGDRCEFPVAEDDVLVLGHWHPSVSIRDAAGTTLRLPAFLVWRRFVVLPAFSPFASGFDVSRGLPPEMSAMLPSQDEPAEVLAVTAQRVRRLGRLQPRWRARRAARESARS